MSYSGRIVGELERVAEEIRRLLPEVKRGPMRLWGEPFGRPGENCQVLMACEAVNNCLRMKFADDEVLAVWNPRNVEITRERFRIGSADAMRFTYFYGHPRDASNILYRDYSLQNGLVLFRTNEDRVPGSGWMPESTVSAFTAVEIGE